jgi:hypothetical protein
MSNYVFNVKLTTFGSLTSALGALVSMTLKINCCNNINKLIIIWVMLNSAPGHLLSIPKKENKLKVNDEKTIFYNFEALNAQLTRKSFLISKFK